MLKKLIALFLCLLLVFSFAACKKDKDDIESSSKATTSDPTQDYENDQWDEGENLTEEEKEEIEDLWNDLVQNGNAEIQTPSDSSSSNTNGNNQENNSNSSSSENTSSVSSSNNGSSSNSSSSVSGNNSSSVSGNNSSSTTGSGSSASSSSSSVSSSTTQGGNLNADIEVNRPGIW